MKDGKIRLEIPEELLHCTSAQSSKWELVGSTSFFRLVICDISRNQKLSVLETIIKAALSKNT